MPPFLSGNLKESNIRILESCETKAIGKATADCASHKPGTPRAQSKTFCPIHVSTCSSFDNKR